MNWVLTSEALPEDMEEVLLIDDLTTRTIGYYHKETDCFIRESDGFRLENVACWMPLPEPPPLTFKSLEIEYNSCGLLRNEKA